MEVINHSKIGASSCHRFWECAGSIALGDKAKREGQVKETSRFAMEGTAAHLLAEQCFKQDSLADEFVGNLFEVEDEVFKVTQGMADAVQVYLDKVKGDILYHSSTGRVKFGFEQKFSLSDVDEDAYGTNDAFLYVPDVKLLIIYDLKYGKGIVVEPDGNKQLMYYALGALQENHFNHLRPEVEKIRLVIVQPRAKHKDGGVRYAEYSIDELMHFKMELIGRILATKEPILELKAGKHCKFCPAILICSIAEKSTWRGNTTVSVADAIEAFN